MNPTPMILSMNKNGTVKVIKGVSSLDELRGIGKETFKALGGGEAFLKKERALWDSPSSPASTKGARKA